MKGKVTTWGGAQKEFPENSLLVALVARVPSAHCIAVEAPHFQATVSHLAWRTSGARQPGGVPGLAGVEGDLFTWECWGQACVGQAGLSMGLHSTGAATAPLPLGDPWTWGRTLAPAGCPRQACVRTGLRR